VSALADPSIFADLDETQRQSTVGTVTSFLKQALELIENPGRAGGWVYTDPVVLQTQGQSSGGVPPLIARVAPILDGLDAALARNGARILDIGAGVAALSISCCRVWPAASVVGVDPWEPVMKLAAANIAAAGFEDRITMRAIRIEDLTDTEEFDLAWMPAPFLPRSALETGVPVVARSLRPGGWLVLGRYAAPDVALPQALAELRTCAEVVRRFRTTRLWRCLKAAVWRGSTRCRATGLRRSALSPASVRCSARRLGQLFRLASNGRTKEKAAVWPSQFLCPTGYRDANARCWQPFGPDPTSVKSKTWTMTW
jgi:SAM-dependent methyltransferase